MEKVMKSHGMSKAQKSRNPADAHRALRRDAWKKNELLHLANFCLKGSLSKIKALDVCVMSIGARHNNKMWQTVFISHY